MPRTRWILAALAVLALDVYLLVFHWPDVAGNLAASVIWGTPALVAQHVALRRHADRQHAETRAVIRDSQPTG
ncbi:hypothetical protein DT019_02770 [Streptomyces sp. SDr-06]|uniref:hypothetical protein n=1 Tax=Streptomyces sp. SDr-06 TaxID=2267702 RepID=UPI000DE9AFA6|nr:hypothetical protein [Streptomyces sp. SDr-06]RCH70425.1 hypothetical protein DT019_02770 [Streptomyces sp. SDr-06]